MLHKLLRVAFLCLATQTAFATGNEPNWDTMTWNCPLSIILENGQYELESYYVYQVVDGTLSALVPSPRKHVPHEQLEKKNIYLACNYTGFDTEILIHAKGATSCGGQEVKRPLIGCWTTDPYASKK
jgi:hypothetical protein